MLTFPPDFIDTFAEPRTVLVYTPTRQYGGLDVTIAGLKRQRLPKGVRLVWALCDAVPERSYMIQEVVELSRTVPSIVWSQPTKEGYVRHLAAANNRALRIARDYNFDLLIILQDYIWIPDDGVARFLWLAEAMPRPALLSGLCHLTSDPPPSAVVNPKGLYTIFAEPYTAKPQHIEWHDCRDDRPGPYVETPIRWETNWAAIPRQALHDTRLNFDEEFDKGAAFENQDYAYAAAKLGYAPVVDTGNVALGLPHKKYWPAQYEAEIPQTQTNQRRLLDKNAREGR